MYMISHMLVNGIIAMDFRVHKLLYCNVELKDEHHPWNSILILQIYQDSIMFQEKLCKTKQHYFKTKVSDVLIGKVA